MTSQEMLEPQGIRLAVNGARGRIGSRICALALADTRFEVVAQLGRDDHQHSLNALVGARRDVDVVVDFSTDVGARNAAQFSRNQASALIVGTTGLSEETIALLQDASKTIAVMIAPNVSPGVAVLHHLVVSAQRMLGGEYDVRIIETHRRGKRDAPSGTAQSLAKSLKIFSETDQNQRIESIREGDCPGEHVVQFEGLHERIVLSHAALSRDIFAHGALRAAAWLALRPGGMYSIDGVYGLRGDD